MTRDPASNSNDRHLSKNVHAVPARDSLAVEEDLHAPSLAFLLEEGSSSLAASVWPIVVAAGETLDEISAGVQMFAQI